MYENLARVALFVEQARLDEAAAVNEPVDIDFRSLQDDPESGLHSILCRLHHVADAVRRPLVVSEVDAALRSIVVPTFTNKAGRHRRDCIVLRDLLHLSVHLANAFDNMAKSS